jgi:DNA-binding response OmpR family regulator
MVDSHQPRPDNDAWREKVNELEGKRILIVDDDVNVLSLLESVLSMTGAEVYAAEGGVQALELFNAHAPDLVLLDIMMPDMNGLETCTRIQQRSRVPIIFLTALSQDNEVVRGLESGAVDYVTKPFSPRILVARAGAALRQAAPARLPESPILYDDGHLRIDLAARRVFVQGQAVKLTPMEYGLLLCLFQNAGCVMPYEEILERVWGEEYQDSVNYVHVYVRYLRQKLEPDPNEPAYILTERGTGYRFRLAVD